MSIRVPYTLYLKLQTFVLFDFRTIVQSEHIQNVDNTSLILCMTQIGI